MFGVLAAIPFFCFFAVLFLYRHNGKKQVLRLDFVQFVYSMIIFPLLFVWLKSLMFFLLRDELAFSLSTTELFWIDSVISLVMLYIYGFVMIHSLTKTFNLRYFHDPLYDLILHSEWFHLWFSHIAMYSAVSFLLVILSVINILFPFGELQRSFGLYSWIGLGSILGMFGYATIYLSDPKQGHFLRIMKLLIALLFICHGILYFWFTPPFQDNYSLFWTISSMITTLIFGVFVFDRSEKSRNLLDHFKHYGWEDFKIHLFDSSKK